MNEETKTEVVTSESLLANTLEMMDNFPLPDISFGNPTVSISNGWKISIQGKSVDDAKFVFNVLHQYLFKQRIPFKVGTAKRCNHANVIQSKKIMTIYMTDGTDVNIIAKDIFDQLSKTNYIGWKDIAAPPAYTYAYDGIYIRNDRDENGKYVMPT